MLHNRAMLCDLTMTSFTGIKTSKKDTQDLLEAKSAQRGAASVVIRLIPSSALAPITSITSKIRAVHNHLTLPWTSEYNILPTPLFMEHCSLMNDGFAERDEAISNFLQIYPQLAGPARQALGDLDFERLWVPVEQVRAAFSHKVRHWPIPQGTDFRCDLDDEDLAKIRAQADAEARALWQGAMSNIHTRIVCVMQGLIEKLENFKMENDEYGNQRVVGTFRDSIFDAAAGLIDIIPHFNIDNDPDVARAAVEMQQVVNAYSPERLRLNADARKRTIDAAKSVIELFN